MKYQKSRKHPVAFLLAALLACQPITAQAVTFADMNNVPWPGAEKSINKAAELGLVVGETINGKSYFKPKDPVSLTQACQLAYKLLLQTDKAEADAEIQKKWSVVMNTYKIQTWAQPAVSFCLENGIIQISDLSGFVKGEVNVSATREQAAEILGRALEVGVPSLKASTSTTIFKDNASISADARPYVALLNSQKIVNGDDLGKFNPKSTLNRTETAVMVTNLYSVLDKTASAPPAAKPSSQSGKVAALTNFYVNFENSNSYYLYTSAGIPVTLNGDTSSVADAAALFKSGTAMSAVLSLDGNNRITAMAVTADNVKDDDKAKDTKGIITDMTYDDEDDDGKLEINDDSTYYVDDVFDVNITIEDEDGDERDYDWDDLLELFEECEDDDKVIEVELTLYSDGDLKKIVGEITDDDSKKSDKPDGDVEGDVDDVDYDEDDDKGEIEVDGDTYEFDDDTDIEIDDESADWEDLLDAFEEAEDDDEVLEAVLILDEDDDEYATDIYIFTEDYEGDSDDEDEVSGKLESITYDEDEYDAEIKVDGDTFETDDIDDVEIEVQDGDTELDSWEELYYAYKDGKTVELELVVDGDEVLEITGNVTVTKGYLTGFGDDYLKLEGKKSEDSFKYYFTEYDRDDEDEEEDWEDDVKDIEISGLSNIDDLYDFFDTWLDDDDTKLGTDDDDDCFDMEIKLDKDGFIVEIEADLK